VARNRKQPPILRERASGVLLHPTSLPGGRLGEEAYRFVDWLAAAGQSWWQVLPLGPPDEHGSPYNARSAFAGSTSLLAEPRARVTEDEVEDFVARHPYWAGEWAAFEGRGALAGQVRFEREWTALRRYAAGKGVRIFGDLPIYVSAGGADHYSNVGQLWGNPLYRWEVARAEHYRWWIERFRRTFELVDLTRIDHFRGFVAYWAVSPRAKTAKDGRWRRGPGIELFEAARRALGELPLVAEDLGRITPPVYALRDRLGLPGMVVMQFAIRPWPTNPHRLENHRENLVVYTGTHDHNTAVGWWETLPVSARRRSGLDPRDPAWSLIEAAFSSPARLAIVPAQDVLSLGAEARLNTPGRSDGNWSWRLRRGQLTDELAARLRAVTEQHRRLG
jgi:4-alpha-glucanotransferase